MKIGILGIGGVGGYFGGLLAKEFGQSDAHEIIFLTRSETKTIIDEKGLELKTTAGNFTVKPSRTISNPNELETLDVLICAMKSYDLESAVKLYAHCINENTLIIPLLNGVNSRSKLAAWFPHAQVCDGCVYIVSFVEKRGVIVEQGGIQKLSFGSTKPLAFDLEAVQELFVQAGIKSLLTPEIDRVIWEKYIFISSVASLTSVTDMTLGAILDSPVHKTKMELLLREVIAVGQGSGVDLPDTLVDKAIAAMAGLPHDTTSSMQRDFRANKKTEVENLTGFVAELGKRLKVPTPVFEEIYRALSGR